MIVTIPGTFVNNWLINNASEDLVFDLHNVVALTKYENLKADYDLLHSEHTKVLAAVDTTVQSCSTLNQNVDMILEQSKRLLEENTQLKEKMMLLSMINPDIWTALG